MSSTPADTTSLPDILDSSRIASAFALASQVLLSWPTTVSNNRWLKRDELGQLETRIESETSSTNLLLGATGSGKSALLAKLGCQRAAAGQTVLAIKADMVSLGVDSLGRLSEELHLPAMVMDCIRVMASSGKIIILIDQLDALADLVDLRSERLNVLLTLIKQLRDQPNVHVVCSCREFEHRHDIRLTSIEADVVELHLPRWEQIAEVLKDRQIDASNWPEEFRELLRTPQHLKVFLQRLRATDEHQVFTTYQQLLENLWERLVMNLDGAPGRSQLLMEMAEVMAQRETIWLPAVLFEERHSLVIDLEAKSILRRSDNGLSVGFQHQTFFEHARARAFARGQGGLASYILPRQDGLFVRPILWSSLNFLRGADQNAYHREMQALWPQPLRKHVRHLLLDFLGQVTNPPASEAEQQWLIEYLRNSDYRSKVLAAIRGNQAWFTILSSNHFPPIMRGTEAEAWPMVGVLGAAWKDHRMQCLELLRQHWVPDPAKDLLTWRTLEQLAQWDAEAGEIAERIIQRKELNPTAVMSLASQVAQSAPTLAVHLVATKLWKDLSKAEALPDPVPPALPQDADEMARLVQMATFRARERFESLLHGSHSWYDLPALAEAAPNAYVEEIWPWFARVVDHLAVRPERIIYSYRREAFLDIRLRSQEEDERMNPVIGGIEVALRCLADSDPASFLSLVEREKSHDASLVQRLFCRTFHHLVTTHAGECLKFLTEDPRRFALGPFDDEHADTRTLIEILVPHLTNAQAKALEHAILGWSPYRDDVPETEPEVRFEMRKWERQLRLQLLAAFPLERLSAETQALVRRDQIAFPGYKDAGVSHVRGGMIGSPMSAEQMARAKDDDIVRLFTILEDCNHSHPKDPMRGGSIQASQEFGRFAKSHPERALSIVGRFLPGKQERPAAHALDEFSQNEKLRETLFSLILDLDQRGFGSEEFRVHTARALGNCAKDEKGLPDSVCALLERWLAEPWTEREPEVKSAERRQEQRPQSVLWRGDRAVLLPFGPYYLLHTLTYGYLLRKPPAAELWLRMLESHLRRDERLETWRVLSRQLKYLHLCDRERTVAFFQRLFEKYPGVRDSLPGAALLTHVWWFLPPEFAQQSLRAMRDGSWDEGPQAYGELLALRMLVYPGDEWTKEELRHVLEAPVKPVTPNIVLRLIRWLLTWLGFLDFRGADGQVTAHMPSLQQVRIGVAFTAAQLWRQSQFRERATDILVKLIPMADAQLSQVIMNVFISTEAFYADDSTWRLLRTLLAHPDVLRATEDSFLIEQLEEVLPVEPDLVFNLCRELVRIRANELTSIQTGFAASTSHLTNIALTLQRLGGDWRKKGLDLFEMLLDLGLQDAQTALQELDKRPRNVAQPVRRRLRRRSPGPSTSASTDPSRPP